MKLPRNNSFELDDRVTVLDDCVNRTFIAIVNDSIGTMNGTGGQAKNYGYSAVTLRWT
jgi:hypothetical protein